MRNLVRTYPGLIPLIAPSYQVPSRFLFLRYGIAESPGGIVIPHLLDT